MRHAFWRDTHGEPYRGTDEKHAPQNLLRLLSKGVVVNTDGTLDIPFGPIYLSYRSAIAEAIVIETSKDGDFLCEDDHQAVVREAVDETLVGTKCQPIKPAELMQTLDKKVAAFLRRPVGKYFLLTSVSTDGFPSGRIAIRNCVIKSMRRLRSSFPQPEPLMHTTGFGFADHLKYTRYARLRISTEGHSTFNDVV